MNLRPTRWRGWMVLCLLFALSVPLVTPYLRGDGVGYYAWLRSAVMDHDLQFANEYRHGDPVVRRNVFDEQGHVRRPWKTGAGHVANNWGVGAAAMWAPFFIGAHGVVAIARLAGFHWHADGFSIPYRWACAFGTALYAFLALLIAHRLARRRVSGQAAFVAVLVVWGASSLFVYQYLLPFWPFGAAAFVGAVLLWLWDSKGERTRSRWFAMGALTGLAGAIHPVAVAWGALPLLAILDAGSLRRKLRAAGLVAAGVLLGAAPQLIGKAVVYGSPFTTGYGEVGARSRFSAGQLFRILLGANHGLFSWTPIAFLAIVGLAGPLWRRDRRLAVGLLSVFVLMVFAVAFLQFYEQSSFGNRF